MLFLTKLQAATNIPRQKRMQIAALASSLVMAALVFGATGSGTAAALPHAQAKDQPVPGSALSFPAATFTLTPSITPTSFPSETPTNSATSYVRAPYGTIIDMARADGDFTTLLAALGSEGLTATLNGKGPFTVFAPTDEAFQRLLDSVHMTRDALLNIADLAGILEYHVVPGKVTADDLQNYRSNNNPDQIIIPTLDGDKTLSLTFAGDGTITINDTAKVTLKNVLASNGVIHVIDAVLIPPASQ